MVNCAGCGREFDQMGRDRPATAIAVEVMGDEYIRSFFFCGECEVYTQETYHDKFVGEDSVKVSGPIDKAVGDALVELVRTCPKPMNKKCTCQAHHHFM